MTDRHIEDDHLLRVDMIDTEVVIGEMTERGIIEIDIIEIEREIEITIGIDQTEGVLDQITNDQYRPTLPSLLDHLPDRQSILIRLKNGLLRNDLRGSLIHPRMDHMHLRVGGGHHHPHSIGNRLG